MTTKKSNPTNNPTTKGEEVKSEAVMEKEYMGLSKKQQVLYVEALSSDECEGTDQEEHEYSMEKALTGDLDFSIRGFSEDDEAIEAHMRELADTAKAYLESGVDIPDDLKAEMAGGKKAKVAKPATPKAKKKSGVVLPPKKKQASLLVAEETPKESKVADAVPAQARVRIAR